jgi:hypothetical protein
MLGGVFHAGEHRYRIRPPGAPWETISSDQDRLAFRRPDGRAAMALLRDCDEPEPGALPWVARHLFFGLRDRDVQRQERTALGGRPAVRTRLTARLEGAPVVVEAVTLRHAGCLYDFVCVAHPEAFGAARAEFAAFLESWVPSPAADGERQETLQR